MCRGCWCLTLARVVVHSRLWIVYYAREGSWMICLVGGRSWLVNLFGLLLILFCWLMFGSYDVVYCFSLFDYVSYLTWLVWFIIYGFGLFEKKILRALDIRKSYSEKLIHHSFEIDSWNNMLRHQNFEILEGVARKYFCQFCKSIFSAYRPKLKNRRGGGCVFFLFSTDCMQNFWVWTTFVAFFSRRLPQKSESLQHPLNNIHLQLYFCCWYVVKFFGYQYDFPEDSYKIY